MTHLRIVVAVVVALVVNGVHVDVVDESPPPPPSPVVHHGDGYTLWCVGECSLSAPYTPPHADGGVVLMGGASDVDGAYAWMARRAHGGNFVVLRASGSNGYDDYVCAIARNAGAALRSCSTLLFTKRAAAFDATVTRVLAGASVFWFAGGDQQLYWQLWQATPVVAAVVRGVQQRGALVGGTSAGEMSQSTAVFTAEHGSVVSAEALDDPFDVRVALGDASSFLSAALHPQYNTSTWPPVPLASGGGGGGGGVDYHLNGTLFDSHFEERDRMGRLLAFGARALRDGLTHSALLVGVNEQTALLVYPDSGRVDCIANAGAPAPAAFFVEVPYASLASRLADPSTFRVEPRETLVLPRYRTFRAPANASDVYNVKHARGNDNVGRYYELSVDYGRVESHGNDGKIY